MNNAVVMQNKNRISGNDENEKTGVGPGIRLGIFVSILFLVVFSAIMIVTATKGRNNVLDLAGIRLQHQAQLLAELSNSAIQTADLTLISIGEQKPDDIWSPDIDRSEILHKMQRSILFLDSIENIYLIDPEGRESLNVESGVLQSVSYENSDFFIAHRDNWEEFTSGVVIDPLGRQRIGLTRRITGNNGKFGGVLMGTIDPVFFQSLFFTGQDTEMDMIFLVNVNGLILAAWPYHQVADDADIIGRKITILPALEGFSPDMLKKGGTEVNETASSLIVTYQLRDYSWRILTALHKDKILANWSRNMLWTNALAFLLLAVLVGLVLFTGRLLDRRQEGKTELARSRARLRLIQFIREMTQAAYETEHFHAAVHLCLDRVCHFNSWPGAVCLRRDSGQIIVRHEPDPGGATALPDRDQLTAMADRFHLAEGKWVEASQIQQPSLPNNRPASDQTRLLVTTRMIDANPPMLLFFFADSELDHNQFTQELVSNAAALLTRVFENKKARDELLEAKRLLDESQKMARIGGWEMELDGRRQNWTAETYRIHELDPNLCPDPETGLDCYTAESRERLETAIQKAVQEGQPFELDLELITASDHRRWVRNRGQAHFDQGHVVKLSGTIQDITLAREAEEARSHLEKQLRQAQKMEALGTLSGGVAHDFNNILGAVVGFSELVKMDLPPQHPSHEFMNQVLIGANRAKDLVKQILMFTRKDPQMKKTIHLSGLIEENMKLVRATLPKTVEIKLNLGSTPHPVTVDPTQMTQLIMNLCTNAAQAMPQSRGLLEIAVEAIAIAPWEHDAWEEISPGNYVRMMFRDNGEGIDPSVRSKVFDPFFTTKDVGQGTGMGLAVVHGIVKSHGGFVNIESEPGMGSTFYIHLPLANREKDPEEAAQPGLLPKGRGEHILFVDDEEALVEIGRSLLTRLGYRVTAMTSSLEALNRFRKTPLDFDLIITDQTMPRMTGLDMAREMLRLRPEVPILLCTGFTPGMSAELVRKAGIKSLLMKPLSLKQVADSVHYSLNG